MLRRYALGVLGFNLAVILWGAYVRATGSGAGCGAHWPTCNGEVIPRSPGVETLVEMTHRVTSGLALLLVLGLLVAAFRSRPKGHPARPAAVASFVLILLEAAIGAGIVLLEYVALNESVARVYWMGAHLLNTFLLVGALALTVHWAAPEARRGKLHRGLWPVGLALLAVLGVGVTGAVTALGDTLFPAGSLREGIAQDFASTAHFLVRLRLWHPVAAVVAGLWVAAVAVWTGARRPEARPYAQALVGLYLLQLAGGFLNLALLAPVWMQLVHLLFADLTWIGLVLLGAVSLRQSPLTQGSARETPGGPAPSGVEAPGSAATALAPAADV
jgi:heme A synthase